MPKQTQKIFYSWQSDRPAKANRSFIQTALTRAFKVLAARDSIAVEPVLDSDTRNVAGAPRISDTIFAKIDTASAFVADVTIIGKTSGTPVKDRKSLPNPNVLVELGYALKVLGDERLILIANTAYGRIEDLPFDLLGRRTLPYTLAPDHLENNTEGQKVRKQVRDKLQGELEVALERILLLPPVDRKELPAPMLILQGARSLREKAAASIGPRGGRIAYFNITSGVKVLTRDGLAISNQLSDRDQYTRQGIELLSKTATEIRQQVGDGAKTALLLCYELVRGGYEAVEAGEVLEDVLNGMERAVQTSINYINKQRRVCGREDIVKIARTAGGAEVAKLVNEAFERAKPGGVWMVTDGVAPSLSSVEIQDGIRFDRGFLAEEFANDASGNCVLNDCLVLVCEGKIHSSQELAPVIRLIAEQNLPVLVLAEEIEGTALHLLIINNHKNLSCVAVKAPHYGGEARSWLKDISAITGASVLGGMFGKRLENAQLIDLGRAERVIVDRNVTQIIPGTGNEKLVATRIALLDSQVNEAGPHERDQLRGRLANLIGNTAVIRVGGVTQDGLLDTRYRVETAMHAVRAALGQGYVLGGGLTYFNARPSVERDLKRKGLSSGEIQGIKVVHSALQNPIDCLLKTLRETPEGFVAENKGKIEIGFNLISKRYESLRDSGVWDAAQIVEFAMQVAFSHAKMILETTSWDVTKPDPPFL
jgi:chaperonin GroEL